MELDHGNDHWLAGTKPSAEDVEEQLAAGIDPGHRNYPNAVLVAASRESNQGNHDALRAAYERLRSDRVSNLHYLAADDLLGHDGEGARGWITPKRLGWDAIRRGLPACPAADSRQTAWGVSCDRLPTTSARRAEAMRPGTSSIVMAGGHRPERGGSSTAVLRAGGGLRRRLHDVVRRRVRTDAD
ncbi:hypothetical protein GCM10010530_58480 [Kribbella aluminosa]